MKLTFSLILSIIASLPSFAQVNVGIQSDPCASVKGTNNLSLDFGGLCKYEALNKKLPPAGPNRVVYIGDSITEFWRNGIQGIDPQDTINRGYAGQTTMQMRVRFRADVIKLKPRIVHIMAGTNDIAGNTGPTTLERIKDNIRSMAEEAQMHGIRVVLGSTLPAKQFSWRPGIQPAQTIRTFNTWLRTYAQNSGHTFIDYHSALADSSGGLPSNFSGDGVHPNQTGYAVMKPLAARGIHEANRY